MPSWICFSSYRGRLQLFLLPCLLLYLDLFSSVFMFLVYCAGNGPRATRMPGECSTTEPHSLSLSLCFDSSQCWLELASFIRRDFVAVGKQWSLIYLCVSKLVLKLFCFNWKIFPTLSFLSDIKGCGEEVWGQLELFFPWCDKIFLPHLM